MDTSDLIALVTDRLGPPVRPPQLGSTVAGADTVSAVVDALAASLDGARPDDVALHNVEIVEDPPVGATTGSFVGVSVSAVVPGTVDGTLPGLVAAVLAERELYGYCRVIDGVTTLVALLPAERT